MSAVSAQRFDTLNASRMCRRAHFQVTGRKPLKLPWQVIADISERPWYKRPGVRGSLIGARHNFKSKDLSHATARRGTAGRHDRLMCYTVVHIQISVMMCVGTHRLGVLNCRLNRLHDTKQRHAVHAIILKSQRMMLWSIQNL